MAVDIHSIRRIALALPGVEEGPCHGTPAFYVRGKMLLRLREDGETLAVAFPKDRRDALIDAYPDVFSVTDHFLNYDYVLLDMIAAREPLVAEMVEGAWRRKAGKRAVAAKRASARSPRSTRERRSLKPMADPRDARGFELKLCPPASDEALNALFAAAWPSPSKRHWQPLLDRALFYVCAYGESQLVGFAKVVGDGGAHGFLLDPTVSPAARRNGIGRAMVLLCAQEAKRRGVEWLHVDFEPRLKPFYDSCGFQPTAAGLLDLKA